MTEEARPSARGKGSSGKLPTRLARELKALALTGLFFLCWITAFLLLKHLILQEYGIEFGRVSIAFVGALILSKVVLVLELVPLGAWVQSKPAWVDVTLRTIMYSAGVAVVLMIEKGFEGRHDYGGFVPSLQSLFHHADIQHVYVNLLCVSGALLCFNILSVIRAHLGAGGLLRLFRLPPPTPGKG